jgi:uncharacterized protein YlzI (FlbEa/FlbD family)
MKKTITSLFVSLCCLSISALAQTQATVTNAVTSDLAAKMTALDTQVRVLNEKLKAEKAKSSAGVAVRTSSALSSSSALLQLQILNPDLALAITRDCGSEGPSQPPDEEPSHSCVPHCTFRLSNGSCASYGNDFCGHDVACVPHCTFRLSNGNCASYGDDYCGSDVSCSPNCTFRLSNGDCANYGDDTCG